MKTKMQSEKSVPFYKDEELEDTTQKMFKFSSSNGKSMLKNYFEFYFFFLHNIKILMLFANSTSFQSAALTSRFPALVRKRNEMKFLEWNFFY